MKTQNVPPKDSNENKATLFLRNALLICCCMILGAGSSLGSTFIKLRSGQTAVTLSGGKIAVLSPPPASVIYTYNLPGDHICTPIKLERSPVSIANGLFVIPTTGGNVALFSKTGFIKMVNLPGDHIGKITEFKNGGGYAVQTTGGLFSFFNLNGDLLGTLNVPGDHATGIYNYPKPLGRDTIAFANQKGEVFITSIDTATGNPVIIKSTNYPGATAAFGAGSYINQNLQIFEKGKMIANLPGAFAHKKAGLILNQNNQVFNAKKPNQPPLNLPGAPAAKPLAVKNGNALVINQNGQIVNVNPAPAGGGGPQQNGNGLNLPGAPFVPANKEMDSLIIPGGNHKDKLLYVNQNGQIWIVDGDHPDGPKVVGGPLNLPNSPLYVVRNGIPGVYVVATTGGNVHIVDARGPGGPVVLASFDFPGEHTGKPTMDKDSGGTNYARISTTGGVFEINKSTFLVEELPEEEMDGQLVCMCQPLMPGVSFPGAPVEAMFDMSSMGEAGVAMAIISVCDASTGENLFMMEYAEPPYFASFEIPLYALPGDALTVTIQCNDFDGMPSGWGSGTISIANPLWVEATGNLEGEPGEWLQTTVAFFNKGFEPADIIAIAADEKGWPLTPDFTSMILFPGDSAFVGFEIQIPETQPVESNRVSIMVQNMIHPEYETMEYFDIWVRGEQQEVVLLQGWNGLSSYLNPVDENIVNMMSPISNELIILRNLTGVYWPGAGINTLVTWDTTSGYVSKVSQDAVLTVTGSALASRTLTLNPGWHIIPMLSSTATATASLFNVPQVMLVKEIAGAGVYWPSMGINTLMLLNPGESYYVYVTAPVTISYPAKSAPVGGKAGTKYSPGNSPWPVVEPTPGSHLVAVSKAVSSQFNTGDVIGAFNSNGVCVGYTTISGTEQVIAIYADDPTTPEVDGMVEGELITYRIFDAITAEERLLDVQSGGDAMNDCNYFTPNGISVLELKTGIEDTPMLNGIKVFPNPASTYLRINLNETPATARLILYDIIGNEIINTRIHSAETTLNISGLAEGCYLLRISLAKEVVSKKIVIRK